MSAISGLNGGDSLKSPHFERLHILKPGDCFLSYDCIMSNTMKETTIVKIDTTETSDKNPGGSIELEDYFHEGIIQSHTKVAIFKYASDDGDLVIVPVEDRFSLNFKHFQLVHGQIDGYRSVCDGLES